MRLLTGILVLAMATTAFGAGIEMTFCATADNYDYGQNLGKEILLYESDTAFVNIWLHLEASEVLAGWSIPLGVSPTPVDDFTWEAVYTGNAGAYYAYGTGPTSDPTPTDGGAINGWFASNSAYPYLHMPATGALMLATLEIHCTGTISDHDIFFADLGNTFITLYESGVGPVDTTVVDLGGVTVHQDVPEPASLALLALGGLALIRRR